MNKKNKKKEYVLSLCIDESFSFRDMMIERVKNENYFLEGDIRFVEASTATN